VGVSRDEAMWSLTVYIEHWLGNRRIAGFYTTRGRTTLTPLPRK